MKKLEKVKKVAKSTIVNYKEQKRLPNYKKKQYELNKRKLLKRKQTESNKEIKQKERKQ